MATVLDKIVLNTTGVNFQQIKMHFKNWAFSFLTDTKTAWKSHYLFIKNLSLDKSMRPRINYCHPVRKKEIGTFNGSSASSSQVVLFPAFLFVCLWSYSNLTLIKRTISSPSLAASHWAEVMSWGSGPSYHLTWKLTFSRHNGRHTKENFVATPSL